MLKLASALRLKSEALGSASRVFYTRDAKITDLRKIFNEMLY